MALSTAAAVTTRIGLGTGILLAAQHEPILLAKQVATLDHLSGGHGSPSGSGTAGTGPRLEAHGVDNGQHRHDVVREHLAAMEAIWSADQAEYHGELVDFGPTWSWPKPVRRPRVARPRRRRVQRRRAHGRGGERRRLDPHRRQRPGRRPAPGYAPWPPRPGVDPADLSVVPFGTIADRGKLEHYAGLGITEVVLRVRAGDEASVRRQLESLAPLIAFAGTLEQP